MLRSDDSDAFVNGIVCCPAGFCVNICVVSGVLNPRAVCQCSFATSAHPPRLGLVFFQLFLWAAAAASMVAAIFPCFAFRIANTKD